MTVAILRDSGDIIWMDAVVSFQQSYTSSVSKHPIESGSVVTDHVTEDNPTMRISGVVSGVDFSAQKPIISGLETEEYGITRLVNTEEISFITVNGTQLSGALRFLPESLSQFLGSDTAPVVTMQEQRTIDSDPINTVRKALIELNRGVRKVISGRVVNIKETFTILEVTPGGKVIEAYQNCVLTGCSFAEDASSGYALYPELTIERVRFVDLVTTTLPDEVSTAIKNSAATKSAKGKQANKGNGTSTSDTSAKKGPTDHGRAPPRRDTILYKKAYKVAEEGYTIMAMNYTQLPLYSDPVWTMTFAIENINRTLNFYWNERQSTWHFDVLNDQNVPVLLGVRLVENYPIAVDYALADKGFNGYFILEDAGESSTNSLDTSIGALAKYYRLTYAYEV